MLRNVLVLLVCWFALSLACAAADIEITTTQDSTQFRYDHNKTAWWASLALLGAASAADIHSSWDKRELNPLLRGPDGRFGPRGAAIKLSVVGTGTLIQWLVLRKHPKIQKRLAIMNAGLSGWFAAAAVHNSR